MPPKTLTYHTFAKNNRGDDLPGEIYKPVKYQGVIWDRYVVSQYGTVIGPQGKKLKWSRKSKTMLYPRVTLHINTDNPPEKMKRYAVKHADAMVHRIVAETHVPISENLPYEFQDIRRYLTQEHFDVLERLFFIDHIDDDKENPYAENLQWVTAEQNNPSNKKYYMQGL